MTMLLSLRRVAVYMLPLSEHSFTFFSESCLPGLSWSILPAVFHIAVATAQPQRQKRLKFNVGSSRGKVRTDWE